MSSPVPIVLFVYNRPWHAQQTIESLQKNELSKQSDLIIYSDAAKNEQDKNDVAKVREYICNINGFRSVEVIERQKNMGLAGSIIDGVTGVINKYGRAIVLEDDLVSSPYFLKYMNDGLDFYSEQEQVASIHAYIYPIKKGLIRTSTFFLRGADCWGWGTWKRGWDLFESGGDYLLGQLEKRKLLKRFDFDGALGYSRMLKNQIAGRNDSWAVRWYASALLNNKLTLYPCKPLVRNIGLDDSGTHCAKTNTYDNELANEPIRIGDALPAEDERAYQAFCSFLRSSKGSFLKRFLRFIKKRII